MMMGTQESQIDLPKRDRVADTKQAYIAGKIDDLQFEKLIEAAIKDEPPFRKGWFKGHPKTRRKRYTNDVVYKHGGEEYVIDGKLAVPLEREIDRTINVRADDDPEPILGSQKTY